MHPPQLDFDFTDDIEKCKRELQIKREEEQQLIEKVGALLSNNVDVGRNLSRVLHRTRTRTTLIESDATQLRTHLQHASKCAENISAKVRELDVAKSRVVDCLQRVEDLLDLRLCTEGVQAAMQQEDYEQAAQHIHRFLTLDSDLFHMTDIVNETSTNAKDAHSLKHSYDVLRQAQQQLMTIITKYFDEAVQSDDAASVQRFFKLFPLLDAHTIGMQKFGDYLTQKIHATAERNFDALSKGAQDASRASVIYADAITMLFEGVARVLEVHHPLIVTYYGQVHMLSLVQHLQKECDKQCARICDEFVRVRQFDRKARAVRNLLRAQHSKRTPPQFSLDGQKAGVGEGEGDPLELDELLSEVTLIQTRAALYTRFVRRKVQMQSKSMQQKDTSSGQPSPFHTADKMDEKRRADKLAQEKEHEIKLHKLLSECIELMGDYIAMEEYYMECCVHKAMQLHQATFASGQPTPKHHDDTVHPSNENNQHTSTAMLDDVLYVLRKCVRRALSSANVDCVCAVMNNAATILDTTYMQVLQGRLKVYTPVGSFAEAYTTAAHAYSHMQHGRGVSGISDGADSQRASFIWALNCARASCDGVQTLRDTLLKDVDDKLGGEKTESVSSKVDFSLSQFDNVVRRLHVLCSTAITQLCVGAVRPRIHASMQLYVDYTHAPNDEQYNDMEVNEPFIEQFIAAVDTLLAEFERQLLPLNYTPFVLVASAEVAQQFERAITKCTFNRLGGMQLDREVRALCTYLTSIGGWSVREKLLRLLQIASVLNVSTISEAVELYQQMINDDGSDMVDGKGESGSRLSEQDFRVFLRLRIDLPQKGFET